MGKLPVGKILFSRWTALVLLALLVVGTMLLVTMVMPLIMVLLVGPGVGIVLLASLLDLSDELPEARHLPHLEPGRVIAFLGIVILVFLLVLGMEVLILGPDLSLLGLGVIPTTGTAVDCPPATNRVSFDNGKVSRMHGLDTGPDSGMAGLLNALGVDRG